MQNGTTVTITQYPLVSSSNSIKVENTNGIYTEINGTDYSTNTSTTINDHTSNITFKPYYLKDIYNIIEGTNIYSLNMTDIPIVDGDSFIYNFNNYYDSIGTMGKYLLQDVIVKQDNLSSVTITEPSFVVMKASTNGTNGTISINGDTINVTSTTPQYYIEYISAPGTYSITSSNSVTITDVFIVEGDKKLTVDDDGSFNIFDGYNTTELTDFNYPLISEWNFASEYASLEGMTSIETFIETYPYYRENFETNRQNDIYQIISKLYGSIHQDTNHPFVNQTDQGYYSIFKDAGFTKDDLREIIELLILADNTAYQTLITNLGSDYYDDILKAIKDPNMQANIMVKIREIADENNITEIQQLVEAAYLGNNYIDNLNTLDDALMYDILDSYYVTTEDEFLFINSDNSIDAVKFTNLINHLSGSSSVDLGGYGIFALSSSKGIGDGIFIPDNFVLSEITMLTTS